MANWLMELTRLAKTDKTALELLRQLKSASTEEEKQKAKENGKEYIQQQETEIQTSNTETNTTTTTDTQPEDMVYNQGNGCTDIVAPVHVVQKKEVEAKYDMSEPAFNPRLAKMGITREEELFQQHVYVRKLTREDKLEIRRSIYQKKKGYMKNIQEKFKQERAEKIAKLQADPEYQKYQHQQKLVIRVVEALKSHCNMEWMFKNIEGLTPDVLRELLKNPGNVNTFKEQKADFVKNFYKKYGE